MGKFFKEKTITTTVEVGGVTYVVPPRVERAKGAWRSRAPRGDLFAGMRREFSDGQGGVLVALSRATAWAEGLPVPDAPMMVNGVLYHVPDGVLWRPWGWQRREFQDPRNAHKVEAFMQARQFEALRRIGMETDVLPTPGVILVEDIRIIRRVRHKHNQNAQVKFELVANMRGSSQIKRVVRLGSHYHLTQEAINRGLESLAEQLAPGNGSGYEYIGPLPELDVEDVLSWRGIGTRIIYSPAHGLNPDRSRPYLPELRRGIRVPGVSRAGKERRNMTGRKAISMRSIRWRKALGVGS